MATVPIVQNSWAAGEVSPKLTSRHDSENSKYHAGAAEIINFTPLVEGPLTKAYGTRFTAEVKNSNNETYLLPFVYNNALSYIVEGGAGYFRFHRNRAYTGAEIATPYSAANIFGMRTAQSGNLEWLVDGQHDMRWLRLSDAGVFTLTVARNEPPPTKELDTKFPGTLLSVSAISGSSVTLNSSDNIFKHSDVGREIVHQTVGRLTIKSYTNANTMVANITETFASVNLLADQWVMKGTPVSRLVASDNGPAGTEVELRLLGIVPGAGELVANGRFVGSLASWSNFSVGTGTALYGGGGAALITGGSNGLGWIGQAISTTAGTYYRMTFNVASAPIILTIGANGSGQVDIVDETTYSVGNQHEVIFRALSATTWIGFRNNQNNTSTLSTVSVKNFTRNGWRAADLGKYIYARGGIIKITAIPTDALARGLVLKSLTRLEEEIIGNTDIFAAAGAWTLQSPIWSSALGHPRTVALHGERLFADGGASHPLSLMGSVTGDFSNFGLGTRADDAIFKTLSADKVNAIHGLMSSSTLLAFSQAAEFSITGGTNVPLSQEAFNASDPSGSGSSDIQPIRTQDGLVVFVDRSGRRLLVLAFDIAKDRLSPDNLTVLAEHITESGVKWMTYNQSQNIVWTGLNNGTLLSLTLESKQSVFAWARRAIGGGGVVEHGVTIPVLGRDETYLMVRRTIGVSTRRYIEVIDEVGGHWGAAVTDCCMSGTAATPTDTLTGLSHLSGSQVVAAAMGLVFEGLTVSGGQVVLPMEITGKWEVGFRMTSRMTMLKPTVKGEANVIHAGTSVHVGQVWADVQDTAGLKLSKDGVAIDDEMSYRAAGDEFDTVEPLLSGVEVFQPGGSSGDLSEKGDVTLIHDIPTPCVIKEIVRVCEVSEIAA